MNMRVKYKGTNKDRDGQPRADSIKFRQGKKRGYHYSESRGEYVAYEDMATRHIINTIALYLQSESFLVTNSTTGEVIKLIKTFGLLESIYDMVEVLESRLEEEV
jgi:hypothetical protein